MVEMDEVALVNTLMGIPLFADLEFDQLKSLIDASEMLSVEPGAVLCESMTIDEQLLVLLEGQMDIESAEGVRLAQVADVRLLGEMGVFTGQPRDSRVVARTPSTLLALEGAVLQELVEEDPDLGQTMLASLVRQLYARISGMNEDIKRLRQRLGELAPNDSLVADEEGA